MTEAPPGRDARHIALGQIGTDGQARIANASALLVGAGGIGCAALPYLAAAGVGRIVVVDFDTVDATNLGRQILFRPDDDGRPKATTAAQRVRKQHPGIDIEAIDARLDAPALARQLDGVDAVLDGTDNFQARFAINRAAVDSGTTLVSGAAIRLEGQLAVFGPDYETTPCYRCLYSEADESLDDCAGNGVLGPVPGVIGTLMAVETLKLLAGLTVERGLLHIYDASRTTLERIAIRKRPDCPVCAPAGSPDKP